MLAHTKRNCTRILATVLLMACCAWGLTACSLLPLGSAGAEEEIVAGTVFQEFTVIAEGWSASGSTPVIMHFEGKTAENERVNYYTAVSANKECRVELPDGYYSFQVLAPVNADGSTYTDAKGSSVTRSKGFRPGIKALEVELTPVPADKVTQGMVEDIMEKLVAAVENGDKSLSGDAGKAVVEKARANSVKSSNVSAEKIENLADKAEENVTEAPTTATGLVDNAANAGGAVTYDEPVEYAYNDDGGNDGGNEGGDEGGNEGGNEGGDTPEPEPTPTPEPEPEPEPTPAPEPEPTPTPDPEP